ncbi:MAG: pectate lyase [Rhodocyclaceae bacterium]
MKQHWQAGLLALTMATLVVGCGGGGGGGGAAASAASSSSSVASSSSSVASSASSSAASSLSSSAASSSSSSVAASSSSSSVTSSSSSSSSSVASSAASSSSSVSTSITSLGATGWATVGTNNLGTTGTTGGHGAASSKTYTVSNRNELVQALYGNTAVINTDGSIASGTLDASKKIIYVSGTISLNVNKALTELTADNYVANTNSGGCAANGVSYTSGTYTTESSFWTAYYAAYKPSVWGLSSEPSGTAEDARVCYAALQKKVVFLSIPSNTSIIGIGSTAKIIHGTLAIGPSSSSPVNNIVIRNIVFEDSFDFFPQWDPTDSGTGRWNSAYDNVAVMYATHVWLDHNEFSDGDGTRYDANYPSPFTETYNGVNYGSSANANLFHVQHHDGLSDVTKNANYVTSSYNYYHDHDKSLLIGGTDTASLTAENPAALKISFHHNWFKNLRQRQPRVRYGMVHIYNNYFSGSTSATNYAWSAGWVAAQGGKIYVENNVAVITGGTASNVYSGSSSSSKVTSCAALSGMFTEYCSAYAYHSGNLLNGSALDVSGVSVTNVTTTTTPFFATGASSGAPTATPASFYSYTLDSTTGLATSVQASAGVGKL